MPRHLPVGRRVWAGVGAVLLAGSALTTGSYLAAQASDHRAAAEAMHRRADLTAQVVRGEILRYQETLTLLAAALSSQTDLEHGDLAMITRPLQDTRLIGASGVIFVVRGTAAQTPSIQRYWRLHGATGLTLSPAGNDPQHVYIVFSRSLDAVPTVLGRDVSTTPELDEALELVQATGRLAVSEPTYWPRTSNYPPNTGSCPSRSQPGSTTRAGEHAAGW